MGSADVRSEGREREGPSRGRDAAETARDKAYAVGDAVSGGSDRGEAEDPRQSAWRPG